MRGQHEMQMNAPRLLPRRLVAAIVPFAFLAVLTACAAAPPVSREATGSTAQDSDGGAFNALAAGITPLTVEQERDEQKRERAKRAKAAVTTRRP